MRVRDRLNRITGSNGWRYAMLALGWLLLALTPVVGIIPGPGGVFVAAAGLALLLKNSRWVKRRYVLFKRRHPRYGAWCDRGLRRSSARRRSEIARSAADERLT